MTAGLFVFVCLCVAGLCSMGSSSMGGEMTAGLFVFVCLFVCSRVVFNGEQHGW